MAQNTEQLNRGLAMLLGRQLGRIRQRYLLHGVGCVLAAVAVAAILYYPLDRYLRLPGVVRMLLTLGVCAYLGFLVYRFLVYPLTRALTQRDVALAIEERFPELRQKLISAIQLGEQLQPGDASGPRNQSREMIEAVVADAAAHARKIHPDELLTARPTAKIWGAAALLCTVVLGFTVTYPDIAGVFVQRVFGLNAAYPRLTNLVIERPSPQEGEGAAFRVERDGRDIRVTLSAGGDLQVLVRADGVVPREVELLVSGGRGLPPRVAMSARGAGRFKHTFRRVSGGFEFHASGGDDFDGDARVIVDVIHPPRVEMVRATVQYPAYTRLPPKVQATGSLEALVGSTLKFEITATAAVQSARLEFIESGQELQLQPVTVEDDGGKRVVYTGDFPVTRSDRYQVDLVGTEGLHNPRPGTYHIVAVPDHPPVGRLLTPEDDGLNVTLPDGMVPVRLHVTDDFGVTSVKVKVQSSEGDPGVEIPMFTAAEPGEDTAAPAPPPRTKTTLAFADLLKPEFKQRAKVNQSLVLTGTLTDNRTPAPQSKEVGPRQVRVVGETELLRRVSSHFRGIKEDVEQNLKLLQDRFERLEDILDAVEAGADPKSQQLPITFVEVAQGRVKVAAGRIHRELMRAFDFHLFNRLETSAHAGTVLDLYKAHHEASDKAERFHPDFYRDISARRRSGRLGAMDKALDPILLMVDSADRIGNTMAPAALRSLSESRVAAGPKEAAAALGEVRKQQLAMIAEFKSLLARLDSWNEYQDVITAARTLLDQQRDIQTRTKNLKGGSDK